MYRSHTEKAFSPFSDIEAVPHVAPQTQQRVLEILENQPTPSKQIKQMVNHVFTEELQNSLMDYEKKKISNFQKKKDFAQGYINDCKEQENRLNAQEQQRREYYRSIMDQQRRREQQFIDDARVHEHKVNQHVLQNLDPSVFHHFQTKYETVKETTKKNLLDTLSQQLNERERMKEQQRLEKERMAAHRMMVQQKLKEISRVEKTSEVENKKYYKQELDRMVQIKTSTEQADRSPFYQPHMRHNPITNPIEYHTENPYIIKKVATKIQPY